MEHLYFTETGELQLNTQYVAGNGSVLHNQATDRLLELYNIKYRDPVIISSKELEKFKLEIGTPKFIEPEYHDPDPEFLVQLSNLSNRLKFSYVALYKNAKKCYKILNVNFLQVAIVHHKMTGRWARVSELQNGLKALGTDEDKMAKAFNSKLDPRINERKDRVKFLDDMQTDKVIRQKSLTVTSDFFKDFL